MSDVAIKVDNDIFVGWTSVTVGKTLDAIAGSFNVSMNDKNFRQKFERFNLSPGKVVSISYKNKVIQTGFITSISPSFESQSRKIDITVTEKTIDLVEASVFGLSQINNVSMSELAKKLTTPFGIEVIDRLNDPTRFEKVRIEAGESPFEVLERKARNTATLFMSDGFGNLVIDTIGGKKSATNLIEGVNILSGNTSFNYSDRFSKYVVKGQEDNEKTGWNQSKNSAQGTAQDENILRYRPKVIVAENKVNSKEAEKRAAWEASVRLAKSISGSIKIVGWTKENGEIWTINELVSIDCKMLGLVGEYLISGVELSFSESGYETTLSIAPRDSYTQNPTIKKEKEEPGEKIGWPKM